MYCKLIVMLRTSKIYIAVKMLDVDLWGENRWVLQTLLASC